MGPVESNSVQNRRFYIEDYTTLMASQPSPPRTTYPPPEIAGLIKGLLTNGFP